MPLSNESGPIGPCFCGVRLLLLRPDPDHHRHVLRKTPHRGPGPRSGMRGRGGSIEPKASSHYLGVHQRDNDRAHKPKSRGAVAPLPSASHIPVEIMIPNRRSRPSFLLVRHPTATRARSFHRCSFTPKTPAATGSAPPRPGDRRVQCRRHRRYPSGG